MCRGGGLGEEDFGMALRGKGGVLFCDFQSRAPGVEEFQPYNATVAPGPESTVRQVEIVLPGQFNIDD
jgi:hypothetical protein